MKKLIIINNGENKLMGIEEVLKNFRGIVITSFKKHKNGGIITEDELQELDIVIFKAFQTYDEEHCFTTHLIWKLKQYITHISTNAKRQKRDTSNYEILNLDMKIGGSKGDKEMELHEMLADSNDFVSSYIDREFIKFIASNLNEFELKLLAINLGNGRIVDLAEEMGTTKQNISNRNRKFKIKLKQLIDEFNA